MKKSGSLSWLGGDKTSLLKIGIARQPGCPVPETAAGTQPPTPWKVTALSINTPKWRIPLLLFIGSHSLMDHRYKESKTKTKMFLLI